MITRLFLKLTDYPAFRRLLWKPIYEMLARRFKVKDWSFMNYGYAPIGSEPALSLKDEDEINRYPIQLYHYLASRANLAGQEVLEVGSGRGGGAAFIKKYHHPKKVTGLDIAINAVRLAREHYGAEGVEFVQGSAEQLPFADESFDVVINVESSHTYGSVPKFLSEVKRVLRKGGYFLCTDIRSSRDVVAFKQAMHSCGMELMIEEDISEQVRRAMELEEPIKQARIRQNVPGFMREIFKQFAGVKGSKAHLNLISGELVYCRFVLRN
jgi:ubiquinone/menaquinone biosynthesis C-methylase UbiE